MAQGTPEDAHYALGWRVYEYAGETLIYHAGAVAGYRTMIGFFPKYHVGVVTSVELDRPDPSGLMPMVFDGCSACRMWTGPASKVTLHRQRLHHTRKANLARHVDITNSMAGSA
jgi:hypothetical protein